MRNTWSTWSTFLKKRSELGLYIGLLPTWGDKLIKNGGLLVRRF